MYWHIVKFRFDLSLDEAERRACEDGVRGLPDDIPAVRFLRMERSPDEPDVTGMVMGFDDAEAFRAYHAHPAHIPVAERIDSAASAVERVDFVTDDDPGAFPGALS